MRCASAIGVDLDRVEGGDDAVAAGLQERLDRYAVLVGELMHHFASYETYLKKMGNNLGTTVNMYNTAYKEFGKIDKDILKITGKSANIEPLVIESPKEDEE